jgi:formylmethanofuran dehydrogenase subunit A
LTQTIAIRGGKIFDPSRGWDGVERDLFIANGRLVDRLDNVAQVINAQGLAVTPGAIDLRSSVAGYGQNYLRLWGAMPSPRQLAESYARLGYTHIHEPFLTIATANYVHQELAAIPILDTSASLTLNLRDFDTWLRDAANFPEISAAWSCLLEHSRALNLRLVEPFVRYRQDFYFHRTLLLETIVELLSRLLEFSDSGITLQATPDLLAAALPVHPRLHLEALGPALLTDELYHQAKQHLENGLSADMGLLAPALPQGLPALPVKIDLGWFQPFDLINLPSPEVARRALHLALSGSRENLAFSVANLVQTPVRDYPRLFSWLAAVDSHPRDWWIKPPHLYTFSDWVKSTRTLPARCLGLSDKGHLQPGARADLAFYDLPAPGTWPECCRGCRLLLKAGEVVVHDFEVVNYQAAKNCYYRRTRILPNEIVDSVCRYHSFRPENLLVRPQLDVQWQQVT